MLKNKRAVALGNFDGLHIGHMAVINSAKAFDAFLPCVLLLEPLPSGECGQALVTEEEKQRLLDSLGVETVRIDFSTIKNWSPEKFFDEIIVNQLNAGAVCCGFNYRFGKGGSGDSALLESLCESVGIAFCECAAVEFDNEPVSSTRIRTALTNGEIEKANAMLGRPFGYCLEVVHGDKIGRLLDCPTLNQLFPSELIVPKYGVYSSFVTLGGKRLRSITNIGRRPSFEKNEQRSETHIMDFNGDLYGQKIDVRLLNYKRGEKKFDSLDELKAQLNKDKE